MYQKTLAAALLAAAPFAKGHYIFSQLVVNDELVGLDYTYVRKNTNTYMPSFTDDVINSPNLICNEGANTASSETYDVKAGDKIGFKLAYNEFIEHPGPGFVYMSLAPGDVSSYTGDGDWFKAYESGLTSGDASHDTDWGTWQKDRIEFTISVDTPDGEYLVRPEHIAIHEAHVGKAQFYMECAQLRVSGGGSGSPSPLVQIPGLYSAQDPGISFNKYSGAVREYEMPGPAVWSGGSTGGASALSAVASSNSSSDSTEATASATDSNAASTGATTGSSDASTGEGADYSSAAAPAWRSWDSSDAASSAPASNWGLWNGASSGAAPAWGRWNSRVKGRRSA